jgi:hypothetical protein
MTCSNLRRAAQTCVVALWPRFSREDPERVKVLSCLQEVSRNIDTLALTEASMPVPLQGVKEALGLDVPLDIVALFQSENNTGNKPVFGTGLKRLELFCKWAHQQEEDVVICAGHSLWFKHFFNTYLPKTTTTVVAGDAKDCKMHNGACVAFDLERGLVNDSIVYRVNEEITVVSGGFENKKKRAEEARQKQKSA